MKGGDKEVAWFGPSLIFIRGKITRWRTCLFWGFSSASSQRSPLISSAAAGASLALGLPRKNKGIIRWRAVFRGFLPIVCFLHDVFGACFHEKTPGNHRTEKILVSWELRRERWEIRGRDLQARNCLCFYRTFGTCLQCFSYKVFFFL